MKHFWGPAGTTTPVDKIVVDPVTFADLGDGRTEVTTHQTNVPAAFMSPEAQAGFSTSLDRFDAYLETLESAWS